MSAFLYAFVSVLLVSLVSLIGVTTLSLQTNKLKRVVLYLVSFAAGALLGDVFLHLLPELIEEAGFSLGLAFTALGGIGVSFVIEKFVHWRHCHIPHSKEHPHPFAVMNLVGDGVHNFIDGIVVGASYLASVPVGIATTIAVFLHEIPQEIGDFGVLLHGGFSKGRALFLNFLLALTALLGVIVVFVLGSRVEGILPFAIAFAGGAFLYIAGSDLIPELHKESRFLQSFVQLLCLIAGVAVMSALLLLK
ncbi:MAG TPA: ZIP family metal transporter [Candidatus Nanoarchaeia archaeon]|nr:ZIP family metal transporter [Candidatus Nanoarchaeia archaeon]